MDRRDDVLTVDVLASCLDDYQSLVELLEGSKIQERKISFQMDGVSNPVQRRFHVDNSPSSVHSFPDQIWELIYLTNRRALPLMGTFQGARVLSLISEGSHPMNLPMSSCAFLLIAIL